MENNYNNITEEEKELLIKLLENDFDRLDKIFTSTSHDDKMMHLKFFAKILCKGKDNIALKIRELIYEFLKDQFKINKLRGYFTRVNQSRKFPEIRQWSGFLTKELKEKLFKGII